MSAFTEIPVIDLSAAEHTVVSEFAKAYGDVGFGYVVGHGIDESLIEAVFDVSARFHALPLETKMAVALDANHRGYIPINTSTDVTSKLADVKKPNQSASFMMMRDSVASDEYLSGPNQWPDLAGFRETLEAYNTAMTDLGRRLMHIAALAIDIAPDNILPAFDTPTTWLRLLHYPPTPTEDGLYGSAPHTDFGCLTLLAQDDIGGLQVMTPEGDWVDTPKLEGSFVVNVGDMLHRLSGGKLRSTPHRVINRSGRERYSCPFFFDPHVSTTIRPLTGDQSLEPIVFGDFLRSELGASYDQHKGTNP